VPTEIRSLGSAIQALGAKLWILLWITTRREWPERVMVDWSAILYLPGMTLSERLIVDAIREYAERRAADFTDTEAGTRIALQSWLDGATVNHAIEEGEAFLRSFLRHPTQTAGAQLDHDPAAPLASVLVISPDALPIELPDPQGAKTRLERASSG
jgi:hypothetical protein